MSIGQTAAQVEEAANELTKQAWLLKNELKRFLEEFQAAWPRCAPNVCRGSRISVKHLLMERPHLGEHTTSRGDS